MEHFGVLEPQTLRDRDPFPPRSRRPLRLLLPRAVVLLIAAVALSGWIGWIGTSPAAAFEAWIRYPIRTGGWNGYHQIHGNHVVYSGQVEGGDAVFLYDIATETTSQITSPVSEGHIESVDVQGNWVVIQADDTSQSDIYLYDIAGHALTNLTRTSGLREEHPTISSGRVVWTGFDGMDWELFMYDTANGTTAPLTNNAVDDLEPCIDGSWVAYKSFRSLANPVADVSIQWVGLPAGGGSRFVTYSDVDSTGIRVRGNFVTWQSDDAYLYDIALRSTTNLSKTYGATNPSMDGGRVVWEHYDGHDTEIVAYELASGATAQITNNSFDDYLPSLAGHEVVWMADTVKQESNVYYCDLDTPGYGPPEGVLINDSLGANTLPHVSQGKIVWTRYRDWPNSDVFLAEKVNITPVPIDPGDLTPPVLSGVQVGSVTADAATITWTTDEAADSQVEYGTTTGYGSSTTLNVALTTSHNQTITGLSPNTLYHFRVRSRDAAGNPAVSADGTFTTPPAQGPPAPVQPFTDVPANHPYAPAIHGLRGAGAVTGYADNTFRPKNTLWRAQFAKMIVEALSLTDLQGQPVSEGLVAPFADLGPDDPTTLYPHDYIALIAQRGVTVGTTPTTFSPWEDVSRAQVISLVVRAAGEAGGLPASPPPGYQSTLGDFSPSHAENARTAEYNGLTAGLVGYGPAWDPWAPATRGECAQIIWNLYLKGFGPGP